MTSPSKTFSGSKSSQDSPPKQQGLEIEEDSEETVLSQTGSELEKLLEESWRNKRYEVLTEEELQARWDALADQNSEEDVLLRKHFPPAPPNSLDSNKGSDFDDIQHTSKITQAVSSISIQNEETSVIVPSTNPSAEQTRKKKVIIRSRY